MKPATEILLSAAFVLTPEENWCKHVFAQNADGRAVEIVSAEAVSFCVRGALYAAGEMSCAWSRRPKDIIAAEQYLELAIGTFDAGRWNNNHTHAEVLAALYRAAEIAEESRD